MIPRAKDPFRFSTRLSLPFLTGRRAKNLRELWEGIIDAPDAVIYQHTHRFLQQHQHLVPEPPNDFAYWVTHMLGDEPLGEKLAAIDTVRFHSIQTLKYALVTAIKEGLERNSHRDAPDGKELYFVAAKRFSIPTPHVAWDLAEFAESLRKVSVSSLYLHIFEARLRPPLGVNDFSFWFEDQLGEKELAHQVDALDPYTQTMESLRKRILDFIEKRLEELSHAAP